MRKIGFLAAIFSLFVIFSAKAESYVNFSLSAPINDANNYDDLVWIENDQTLSSGSLTGGYVNFTGIVSGEVNIRNTNASITSTCDGCGVIRVTRAGNNSSSKAVKITNAAGSTLEATGAVTSAIYVDGFTKPYDFQMNNNGTVASTDTAVYVANGNSSGSFNITNSGIISSNSSSSGPSIFLSYGSNAIITNSGIISNSNLSNSAIVVMDANLTLNILNGSSIVGKITAYGSNNILNIKKNITSAEFNTLSSQLEGSWVKNIFSASGLTINSGETVSGITLTSGGSISNSGTLNNLTSSGGTLNLAAGSSTGNIANSGALTIAVPSSEVTYSNAISGTAQS